MRKTRTAASAQETPNVMLIGIVHLLNVFLLTPTEIKRVDASIPCSTMSAGALHCRRYENDEGNKEGHFSSYCHNMQK